VTDHPFLKLVDAIYVINLEHRTDRRAEMQAQLARIGLGYDDPRVTLFAAVKPSGAGNFPNIGSRGCYMSHLEILRDAHAKGLDNVLILEDDADFTSLLSEGSPEKISQIQQSSWDMFFFGSIYEAAENITQRNDIFSVLPKNAGLKLTHALLLKRDMIAALIPYLEAMAARPLGDPDGGPMHVDGAYFWFHRAHPEFTVCFTNQQWVVQRASRTDIHAAGWKDKLPFIDTARRIKNKLKQAFR